MSSSGCSSGIMAPCGLSISLDGDGDDENECTTPRVYFKQKLPVATVPELESVAFAQPPSPTAPTASTPSSPKHRGRRSRASTTSFDWFGRRANTKNSVFGSAFINLGGVGGPKAAQKQLNGWTLRLSAQFEEDEEEEEVKSPVNASGLLLPAAMTTKEIEADGHKCIWNRTFCVDIPETTLPMSLRVDLHARVDGQLVRVASARIPASELFGTTTGGMMRSVELHRFAPDQIALEQAYLLGVQAGGQPLESMLQHSPLSRRDDPRPADGGGGTTPQSKTLARRLSTQMSGFGVASSPTAGSGSPFWACAALPGVIEVGVAAATDPKRILPVEVGCWLWSGYV
jgi:hypothetical protein